MSYSVRSQVSGLMSHVGEAIHFSLQLYVYILLLATLHVIIGGREPNSPPTTKTWFRWPWVIKLSSSWKSLTDSRVFNCSRRWKATPPPASVSTAWLVGCPALARRHLSYLETKWSEDGYTGRWKDGQTGRREEEKRRRGKKLGMSGTL